jgi:type I restriction enzyme S subunit
MAGEWRASTWGEEISLEYGKALRDYDTARGKYRVFGSNGPIGWTEKPLAPGPGVILGRKGAYRGIEFSREPFFVIDTAYYVVPKGEFDMRWLYFAIKHHKLGEIDDGSPIPSTTRSAVYVRDFDVPPIAEQKAIAAVLAALDDKIELNRRMNATLEAMARALFQSWFVDFDPVRAKLDGHPPAALDPATAALFPEHFAHSEHDMLPVGWRHAAIEEVCAINAWTLGKNDDLGTLEYVEISEVSRGNIANIATYPRGEEPSRARRRLRHGDTVLSTVRPDRGSYFLALNPPANRVASTGFAVLTPTKVPWSFLHGALTQPEVSDHLGQMADGGAYPAVRPEIIGAMQVALPNEPKILEAFHHTCAPLLEQAEANRTQSRTLATMRDTLLPKLLSGELSVEQTTASLSAR